MKSKLWDLVMEILEKVMITMWFNAGGTFELLNLKRVSERVKMGLGRQMWWQQWRPQAELNDFSTARFHWLKRSETSDLLSVGSNRSDLDILLQIG